MNDTRTELQRAHDKIDYLNDVLNRLLTYWSDTEARSAEAHAVYQVEAHRRGDVRHPDAYEELSEATKEWDRVLVRWVADSIRKAADHG